MSFLSVGSDYDRTLSAPNEDNIDPSIVEVLEGKVGGTFHLTLVTGRFPGQLPVIGGESLQRILAANSQLNAQNIHVYSGGANISDSDNNIYGHENHRLEIGQLEEIKNKVKQLIQVKARPIVIFQSAHSSQSTGWKNGELTMIFSDINQVTPTRNRMYNHQIRMPSNVDSITYIMQRSNCSKVIILSEVYDINTTPEIEEIQSDLLPFGLAVTGNHRSGIDISKKDVDKATGLRVALGLLGLSNVDYYLGDNVGEFGNDRPVFEKPGVAKFGIVVANGYEPDMSFARIPYHIVQDQNGLAEYLNQLNVES